MINIITTANSVYMFNKSEIGEYLKKRLCSRRVDVNTKIQMYFDEECYDNIGFDFTKPFDDVVFVEWMMESPDSEFKLIYIPGMDCFFAGLFADKDEYLSMLEHFDLMLDIHQVVVANIVFHQNNIVHKALYDYDPEDIDVHDVFEIPETSVEIINTSDESELELKPLDVKKFISTGFELLESMLIV